MKIIATKLSACGRLSVTLDGVKMPITKAAEQAMWDVDSRNNSFLGIVRDDGKKYVVSTWLARLLGQGSDTSAKKLVDVIKSFARGNYGNNFETFKMEIARGDYGDKAALPKELLNFISDI